MKPLDYHARRQWQDEARARGEIPECGREACTRPANPPWLNLGTPLIYCAECAALINCYNPGLCYPEQPQPSKRGSSPTPEYVIGVDHGGTDAPSVVIATRTKGGGPFLASMFALAAGVDPFPSLGSDRPSEPNPDRGRHREKTERRRERKAANAKRTP